jgi:DNA repair protein RecO (recombination protein O)
MPPEKDVALVVRGLDWSETSRIVTLFTRHGGRIRALAKGGRRLKSNFEAALDLLTVCEVVYWKKHHGGLDLLTEARIAEPFPALRTHLSLLYAGYYVAELLADGLADYDPHPVLYDAAIETLRGFGTTPTLVPGSPSDAGPVLPLEPLIRISAFELVWLKELGYSPRLTACAGCGRSPVGSIGLSPSMGGVVCSACRPTVRDQRPMSDAAWEALRNLAEGRLDVPAPVLREVRGGLGQMVSFVLGRQPRLLQWVHGGSGRRGGAG